MRRPLVSPQDIAPDNPHIAPLWYYRNTAEPPLYMCTEITWHIARLPDDIYEMHRDCVRDDYLWCLVFVHSEEGQPPLSEQCWRIFECEVCGETMSVFCELTLGIAV